MVVFDHGEVISRATAALPTMAAMLGVDAAAFAAACSAERTAYDRGWSDLAYWQAVRARLDRQVDAALAERLTRTDVLAGWTDPGSLRLLEELHRQGVALALRSTAPSAFGRAVEREDWTRLFRHLVFSGDLELAKPGPAVHRALLEVLGAAPGDCLFFDDRPENVDGARRVGLAAELWPGPEAARELLRSRAVLT